MSHDSKSFDRTLAQSSEERVYAQERSLLPARPPLEVPGYRAERFLGAGAYGQVWVAVDTNTGRRVAIKFYTHRGGLDWSLLSREVERLALLFADRYVVQLVDVGWDADPPYFVMEYLEQGSLADRLNSGPCTRTAKGCCTAT
jgi:serine/threonine protein kinase